MSKKIKIFLTGSLFLFGLTPAIPAFAVCPVCAMTIVCGLGLSRWLGVDDIVSGVWLGGFLVSIIIWCLHWLDKKQIVFRFRWLGAAVLSYGIIFAVLYSTGLLGHPLNKFWGIDKLILGVLSGSLIFLLGHFLSNFLKKKNQGKSFFPFQKVVLPVSLMIILSLVFYELAKCGTIK